MTGRAHALRRVLVVADESANWKVGGLRQLERILLWLNDIAARQGEPISATIQWKHGMAQADRWSPRDCRLPHVRISHEANQPSSRKQADTQYDLRLTTHIVPPRLARGEIISSIDPGDYDAIHNVSDIGSIEQRLLRNSGKSQDGWIARHFNRHISRWLTRLLLKFPITPSAWTLMIFPLPIAACAAFIHGGFKGIMIGMLLFEIHSILDGCDGEIARAKYLESESGRRLDTFCDVAADVLLVLGIGFGLWRTATLPSAGEFFALEGIVAAALIVFREWLLLKTPMPQLHEAGGSIYVRHAHLVNQSGILGFGKRFTGFVIQFTKRDIGITFFLLLAMLGRGEWILHLLFLFACLSAAFTTTAFVSRSRAS